MGFEQEFRTQLKQPPMQKLIYRPADLAEVLGVGRTTIYRMEKRGELPPRRKISSGTRGWPRDEIERWISNRPRIGDEKYGEGSTEEVDNE